MVGFVSRGRSELTEIADASTLISDARITLSVRRGRRGGGGGGGGGLTTTPPLPLLSFPPSIPALHVQFLGILTRRAERSETHSECSSSLRRHYVSSQNRDGASSQSGFCSRSGDKCESEILSQVEQLKIRFPIDSSRGMALQSDAI